jgi:2,3-bisphosphoglycerate-independent phosphoglycerate mutase
MTEKCQTHKPIILIILDGWGVNQDYPGNAITNAKIPTMNRLVKEYPSTTLRASGESVGLPWGEPGNSEVGHLNMGLGRVLYQDLPRINKAIADQTFYQNEALLKAVDHVKKNHSNLHFLGVVSNGCVHASVDHLHALMVLAQKNDVGNFFIHAILDGRDTQYNSGLNFIRGVERSIKEFSMGKIATVTGRYYTMDRNNNWDRIEKAYLAMTEGLGDKGASASEAVRESYKKKIYDEEFLPTVIQDGGRPAL